MNLIVKNEPPEKITKIILYILENYKIFKLELLEVNLNYINILVQNQVIAEKIGVENIYLKLYNLIMKENFLRECIIKTIFEILIKIMQIIKEIEIINNLGLISQLNIIINHFESNQDLLVTSLQLLSEIINIYSNINSISIVKNIMDKIIEINLLQRIINYLDITDINNKRFQIFYSLRIIGNFVMIEEGYFTDKLIELNIFGRLKKLIQDQYPFEIRKEATWIISNIAAGTSEQIIQLYQNNFPDLLFNIISKEKEGVIKKNCLWALYNFVNITNKGYLTDLIEKGLLDILISRLKIENSDILTMSLETLQIALEEGRDTESLAFNIIKIKIDELNIQNELINLLKRQIPERSIIKGMEILEFYFKVDSLDLLDTDYEDN